MTSEWGLAPFFPLPTPRLCVNLAAFAIDRHNRFAVANDAPISVHVPHPPLQSHVTTPRQLLESAKHVSAARVLNAKAPSTAPYPPHAVEPPSRPDAEGAHGRA